jgi:hypothetical protein
MFELPLLIEIRTSTVSIRLLPFDELKSSIDADVGGENKYQDDAEKILAVIPKSCEGVNTLLEKRGEKSDGRDAEDERSIAITSSGTSERSRHARAPYDSTDEASELGISSAKK